MNRKRCFTLMELMIAVTIFMLISLALFAFSSQVSSSWSRMTVERNRFNELLAMDRTIDSILSNSIPFLWKEENSGETAESMPFLVAYDDYLRIASLHRLNDADEGAIRFVEFSLENGELLAVYADRPFAEWDEIDEDRRTVSVLSTDVASLEFEYADWSSDVSENWNERLFWRSDWEVSEGYRNDLPLAVKMTVTWNDGRQECWLRRTMGNSFRERYGTYELPADNTP